MKGSKCIILGGNGFIGSNAIRHLFERGFDITSFDLNYPNKRIEGVNYIIGDYTDDNQLMNAIEDKAIIIHLISTCNPNSSMENPYGPYSVDIVQTIKILEKIKNTGKKVIFASSGGTVYGETNGKVVDENSSLNPINHYGIMKVAIENIVFMYNKVFGMKNMVMRISNPYGKGQDYTKGIGIIDALIKNTINGDKITVWGDGNNIRDYIHISDLCEAISLMCNYDGKHSLFNVGSGKSYSINELIKFVEESIGKEIEVEYSESKKIDIKQIHLDMELAKNELNFEAKVSIKDGIKSYAEQLSDNGKS